MSLIEFGTIMNLTKGKKPKNQFGEYKAGLMPYVDIKAFETGRIESYTDGEKCLPCKEDDILIVCDGSRSGLVGKALNGYVGSTLAKISAEGLTQDYLYYFLQVVFRNSTAEHLLLEYIWMLQISRRFKDHLNIAVLTMAA